MSRESCVLCLMQHDRGAGAGVLYMYTLSLSYVPVWLPSYPLPDTLADRHV